MTIILEKDKDRQFGAWLEDCSIEFSGIHTIGQNVEEVTANVRMLMRNILEHDFANNPKFADFNPEEIAFTYRYSLMDFFDTYKDLKINSIAARAGLNASLVRQYASGAANASAAQATKIENAVHNLARSLLAVSVV